MNGLRIAIVEDEVLTIESIAIHLNKMGHEVVGTFSRYETVFSQMPDPLPDLFLLDIHLKGEKNGLEVARELKSRYAIPFMFLTSSIDSETIRIAVQTLPLGYISKPFSYSDLFIGIELAKTKASLGTQEGRKIEIKTSYETEWISTDEIQFLEADRSYVNIHLNGETKVLRQTLGTLIQSFRPEEMVRIHRSFAVNPRMISSIGTNKVILGSRRLPLGPGYRAQFQEAMLSLNDSIRKGLSGLNRSKKA